MIYFCNQNLERYFFDTCIKPNATIFFKQSNSYEQHDYKSKSIESQSVTMFLRIEQLTNALCTIDINDRQTNS